MIAVGVLGAGTWGVALARLLANKGYRVTLWSALHNEIEQLRKTGKHPNLPGCSIPSSIIYTTEIDDAVSAQDLIICVVPSIYVRQTIQKAAPFIRKRQLIVDAAKGIEPVTFLTLSEVIEQELESKVPRVVALSGPTHAEEVARDQLTAIVAASSDEEAARTVQEILMTSYFRVYTNIDRKGVELCGALKNIIALAAGICDGLGQGDNAKAALITRGLAEVERLGIVMGAFEATFSGLTGMGDLIVTCTSKHSRNHRAGELIGRGIPIKDAIEKVGMVVEGIHALPAAIALSNQNSIELPIIATVDHIINHGADPRVAVETLMLREQRNELPKTAQEIRFEHAVIENALRKRRGDATMKRVITYGTFDLLHYGHINLLRRAKALGDYLIVVLSSDEFNWNEKHKKCYFTYEQRKALLESIRYVDLVIPEENWQQKRTDMHEYHIDTFVMGDDWKGKFDFLKEEGVEVVYLPRTPEISSSKMKKDLYDANSVDGESKVNHDEINTDPK